MDGLEDAVDEAVLSVDGLTVTVSLVEQRGEDYAEWFFWSYASLGWTGLW